MNRLIYRGLFIFGGIAFLGACERSEGPIIAQVGGSAITQNDLASRLRDTPAAYAQYLASADGRKQFLNLLIREKVLLLEARRAGLEHNDAYRTAVRQYHDRMRQREKDYKESLLIDSYVRQLRSKDLSVPDGEVRRAYEAKKSEYDHPVEVLASHILLNSEGEAQQALERLKAGEPFEKVAKELSKDPATAVRGGRLKPFKRGALVPEFEEAAFRLRPGETSGIVKTQFGFHIIRKTGERLLPAETFEQVKEELRARLEREKFDQWVAKKQDVLGVKIDEMAMASLKELAQHE